MYMKKTTKQNLSGGIPAATAFTAANCHRGALEVSPEVPELLLYILAALVRWFSGKTLLRETSSHFSKLSRLSVETELCLAVITIGS